MILQGKLQFICSLFCVSFARLFTVYVPQNSLMESKLEMWKKTITKAQQKMLRYIRDFGLNRFTDIICHLLTFPTNLVRLRSKPTLTLPSIVNLISSTFLLYRTERDRSVFIADNNLLTSLQTSTVNPESASACQ